MEKQNLFQSTNQINHCYPLLIIYSSSKALMWVQQCHKPPYCLMVGIPSIKMVMTRGWFMTLLYQIICICICMCIYMSAYISIFLVIDVSIYRLCINISPSMHYIYLSPPDTYIYIYIYHQIVCFPYISHIYQHPVIFLVSSSSQAPTFRWAARASRRAFAEGLGGPPDVGS